MLYIIHIYNIYKYYILYVIYNIYIYNIYNIYIYIYIYIYIFIYVAKKTDNVLSRLLPIRQWPQGNSYTWAHDLLLHIAGINKPKSAQQVKQRA